jgi:hypothetical protein
MVELYKHEYRRAHAVTLLLSDADCERCGLPSASLPLSCRGAGALRMVVTSCAAFDFMDPDHILGFLALRQVGRSGRRHRTPPTRAPCAVRGQLLGAHHPLLQ